MQELIKIIQLIDEALFLWVNARSATDLIGASMLFLSYIGLGWILVLIAGGYLYFMDRKAFFRRMVALVIILSLGGLIGQAIKRTVKRGRPVAALSDIVDRKMAVQQPFWQVSQQTAIPFRPYVRPEGFDRKHLLVLGPVYTKRSFPSGHSIAAFCVATCLAYYLRRRRWLVYLVAAGIAFSRVYIGLHFFSDIIAGAAIGVGWAFLGLWIWERNLPWPLYWKRVDQLREKRPGPLIMIVAGEASADLYGANLARQIRERSPWAVIRGVGGPRMAQAGVKILHEAKDLSLMGFTSVLGSLGKIRRIFFDLTDRMRTEAPDALICLDLPDFNLGLAARAKELGVPVCYYISPQFWAWRRGRLKKIAKRVDRMIVAFPFEKPFYEKVGVDVRYEGHPLLEIAKPTMSVKAACTHFGLDPDRPVIAVLPGSRKSEIDYLLKPLLEACLILTERHPELQFALAAASTVDRRRLREALNQAGLPGVVTSDKIYDLLAISRLGLLASGTATLEAALFALPMVIVYRGGRINMAIARKVVQLDMIGLPNLIAGEKIVPELIQEEASPEEIAAQAQHLLDDPEAYQKMKDSLAKVRENLQGGRTSDKVAEIVLELIEEKTGAIV